MTTRDKTTKEKILEALRDLPDETTVDEAIYRLYVLHKIESGMADIEAGRTVPHEEVLERIRQWRG
ncbi:MAG: hypothetical protein HYY03_04330 [Chloroflexi bacterium]|nr:hypothetical protein [Chloroflexota bacterium]